MKYWFRLFLLIGVVLLVIAAIGSFLPHGFEVAASTKIDGSPADIYRHVETLPAWQQWMASWSPDADIPISQFEYDSDGLTQTWTEPRGSGRIWITDREPDQKVVWHTTFGRFPENESFIVLKPVGDQTEVSWTSAGQLPGGPFYGFFRSVYVAGTTAQFERDLSRLKAMVEKNRKPKAMEGEAMEGEAREGEAPSELLEPNAPSER